MCESSDFSVQGNPQLLFTAGGQSSCASVTIDGDGLFEGEEMYCLTLESSDPDITIGDTGVTCIVIADQNCKLIVLEQTDYYFISALSIGFQPSTYTTTEGSTVGVCVEVLSGSSAVPIPISISTSEGTAEGSVHSQNNTVFHSSFFQETTLNSQILFNLCLAVELPVPALISQPFMMKFMKTLNHLLPPYPQQMEM